MATKKTTTKQAAGAGAKRTAARRSGGFTADEKAAMRAAAKERRTPTGEADLLAAIEAMPDGERAIAARIHEVVTKAAPSLAPRTWYGMPAWAHEGKVLCFFQGASKFSARYSTFGFQDVANLDAGSMWPTSFALTKLTKASEAEIRRLVKQAVA